MQSNFIYFRELHHSSSATKGRIWPMILPDASRRNLQRISILIPSLLYRFVTEGRIIILDCVLFTKAND